MQLIQTLQEEINSNGVIAGSTPLVEQILAEDESTVMGEPQTAEELLAALGI